MEGCAQIVLKVCTTGALVSQEFACSARMLWNA